MKTKQRYRYCSYCVIRMKKKMMDCPQCGKCPYWTCPKCNSKFDKDGEQLDE